jgi:sulfur relay (sulfurtransferase) DsrC/TusE family protein
MGKTRILRVSDDLNKIINYIRAKYMINDKKPPSVEKITKLISKKIKKEDLLKNEFIKF